MKSRITKNLLLCLLAPTLAFCLSACGNDDDTGTSSMDSDTDTDTDVDTDTDIDTDSDSDTDTDSDTDSEGWMCLPAFFGTNDGCDCGCGAADPDCGSSGCMPPDCWEPTVEDAAGCDFCWDANTEIQYCFPSILPEDWLCSPFSYNNGHCDCGCGVPDPDCGDSGCTEPNCWEPTVDDAAGCDYCWDENAVMQYCFPSILPEDWLCNPFSYDSGTCDCGCGAPDPDCGDSGCTEPNCWQNDATGCGHCYDENQASQYCIDVDAGDPCPVGPVGAGYDFFCEPSEAACIALADSAGYSASEIMSDYTCDGDEVCCAACVS